MTKLSVLFLLLCCIYIESKGGNPDKKPIASVVPPIIHCVGTGFTMDDIVISESDPTDFNVSGSGTIVIEASSGTFVGAMGESVSINNSPALTAVITDITNNTVTVTLTETDNDNDAEYNTLTIQGLHFIPNSSETNILYGSASTVSITGMSPGITSLTNVSAQEPPQAMSTPEAFCSGQGSLSIDLGANITNSVPSYFSWSAADNLNVDGETTIITSTDYINDGLVNTSNTPEDVIYTAIPSSAGGCMGNPFTVTVTVNPTPTGSSQTISLCSGEGPSSPVNLNGIVNVSSTFSWYADDNPAVDGETTTISSTDNIADDLINSTPTPEVVYYYVTPTSSMGACVGNPFTVMITVNAIPEGIDPAIALCSGHGGGSSPIYLTSTVNVASSFYWSAVDNPDVAGETTSITHSDYIPDDLRNTSDPQVPEEVVYNVEPTSYAGCVGDAFTVTVTLNPSPDIVITNNTPIISTGGQTDISYVSNLPGTTFTFSYVTDPSPDVSGLNAGSGITIVQTLNNEAGPDTDPGPAVMVQYVITGEYAGCTTDSIAIVMVNGLASVTVQDSLALVALYNAIDGPAWLDKENWLMGAVSSWQGITVDSYRVTEIDMKNNNVSGMLPLEIGDLTALTKLVIEGLTGGKKLGGELPGGTEAGGLGGGEVPMAPRMLQGPIPSSILNLTSLTTLNLSGHAFDPAFPSEILTLTTLEDLNISSNQFTGSIPSGLQNLSSLMYLNLANNGFTGNIPTQLTTLTGLLELRLSGNQLTGAVPDLTLLTNLEAIDLRNNRLSDLPNLSSLLNLADLDIRENNFTFEDIEPNTGIAYVEYSPQRQIVVSPSVYNLSVGETLAAPVTVGGSANEYYWQKNTVDIAGLNSNVLSIPSVTMENAGFYRLRTISSLVPGLTIYSEDITLNVTLVNPADSLALIALYNATNGATGWTDNTNWLTGNVDTWYGITVINGRVVEISLDNNNLVGTLPAEISNLTALESLSLSNNNISGLPAGFFNITSLTYLDLSGCAFSEALSSAFGNFVNLTTLDLAANQFSGSIPGELATSIPGLTHLALNSNLLTGAVPDFSSVSGPLRLLLQDNKLSDLPNLAAGSFAELDVSNNKFMFEDIEPNVGIAGINYVPQSKVGVASTQNVNSGLTFTASFTVAGSSNTYQWIKNEIDVPGANSSTYTKPAITTADAGVYKLKITNSIAAPLTLYSENITLNVLTSVSDSLALVALYSATNGTGWLNKTNWLTGKVNTWYGVTVTAGRVTAINLTNNKVGGTLPAALGNLSVLTELSIGSDVSDAKSTDVNRNTITGTIPAEIGNLSNLVKLNLSSNDLTGTLPASFSGLTQLQDLWLTGNNFTLGAFPTTVLAMTNLQFLTLSSCGITGAVPSQIQNLSSLKQLLLNDNKITALPSEITTLSQLQRLYLRNNLLTALPALSTIGSLTDLRVADNKLTFEDLEPNVSISSFTYSPQDSVGVKNNLFIQAGTAHTFTSSVGGASNQYVWKKNGVAIPGATASSLVLSSPDFVHEGTYTFEVTNSAVTGLTLFGRPVNVRVSSLKRDSLALVQVYNMTKGNSWTNKAGWLSGKLSTWNGVVIANNRVTAINLGNNNLDGPLPTEVNEMFSLKTVDVSNNKITKLPALLALTQLTAMNVSGNKLDFGSLESNLSLLALMTYSNQAEIGITKTDSVQTGTSYELTVTTSGANNTYQWKRNKVDVAGATLNAHTIASLNRTNMGEYHCEIKNSSVPGLTLKTAPVTVLATTDLSGKLLDITSTPVTKGKVTLFRVTPNHGYDTIRIINVDNNGTYNFKKIVLDNYQILGFADTLTHARALPTYYKSTTLWEEADTLFVQGSQSNLDILSQFKPSSALTGTFTIRGIVEEEVAEPGGRVKASKKPIGGAGVSVRRVENTGRGKALVLTLVAHVFTDPDGTFEIPNLPPANYRLNIQYPGYPMNPNSNIDFPITENSPKQYNVEALVKEDKITVTQSAVTGLGHAEEYVIRAYPNPSVEFITMQFATPSLSRGVEMTDIAGKKIMQADAPDTEVSLDVRAVQRGLYVLKIMDKNHVVKIVRVIIK